MAIFPKSTQNGRFWPKCKGGTLNKILEIGHLFGSTSEGSKDRKYLSDLSLIGMDGRGIYLVSNDSKISKKYCALAEK